MSDDGITLPNLRLFAVLGQGGTATVYRAQQISTGRPVAVKVLNADFVRSEEDVGRFLHEAQACAQFRHRNIVRVYDVGEQGGLYYFVMELVEGYTFARYLQRKGQVSVSDVLVILEAVAGALEYAWNKFRVVHCDLKPDNLMVDADGTIKVMDLGVSRSLLTARAAAGPRVYTIAKGQTAWDVARDAYNAAGTLYIFPDGRRVTGDRVRDWESLTVGTRVILGDADAAGSPVQTLAKGMHPRRLIGEAVFASDTWYIRPTGGYVRGTALNEKTLAALPPGTKILVGYAVGGPVTSRRLPAQICPTQWDAPDTFYLMPGKPLLPSGEIDMRRVPAGTVVFYRD